MFFFKKTKQHKKCFYCVTDTSYRPVLKGWVGWLWEREVKYFSVLYKFFFGYTSVSSKALFSHF